ncbi:MULTISPECIES: PepSY domain-containing protein [unclassified Dysgonomonas]|uniref:PepSY-associated TM helix domain-containing protein n=1 Tax=unclassified Dysgonomonas TaxID=2630389 RepID=UPI0025C119C1|nr:MULTISPECIES: PepSY domain-containing protein [unclassified Dysgonomonas]MDR2002572.1 PepSY domain-containing protein [Prevotella sp.]HMM01913.1 PepSY domain-containing protein [Dysgonomonas sp.]
MVSSVFRISHLILAAISSIFLLIAAATGVILAIDVATEKATYPYKVQNFDDITLAQSLSVLRKVYPEITGISSDKNQFVTLEGFDEEGNSMKAIIDPNNGEILGEPFQKSEFINQVTTLHRSLFLHDAGRFMVGIVSFLFLLITVSGIILIIKRQKGIRHFFSKINKDYLPQYLHVVLGRLLLIPVLLISLTGSYLFMKRFKLIPEQKNIETSYQIQAPEEKKDIEEFPVFKNILLSNIERIEFPFDTNDSQDVFILRLKDRELEINQFSGEITKEVRYPYSVLLANLSLDLHTGRANIWLALILGITSFGIIIFIYTGFKITFRRVFTKSSNKYKVSEAEYILLVGSENGTTMTFANKIQKQLIANKKKVFVAYLNQYQEFPKAKHLLIFTSTYGQGDTPANAQKFEFLLNKYPQKQNIQFSVVGFGSKKYKKFCGFAEKVDTLLGSQPQFFRFVDIFMINNRSVEEFGKWEKSWSEKTGITI